MDSQQLLKDRSRVEWKYIIAFYVLAFFISFPFNSGLLSDRYVKLFQGTLVAEWTYLPACLGPFIGAMVVFWLHKDHIRTITFAGNSFLPNLLIALAPLISFVIVGLNNPYGLQPNLFAFVFAFITLVYAVGEEIGWRGYLQDAFRPMKSMVSYTIIGLLWWFWHCRFDTNFDIFVFPLIAIGSSFLIGKLTEDTKSYFVAAGLHSFIIILTTSGNFDQRTMIGGAGTVLIWVIVSLIQKKRK